MALLLFQLRAGQDERICSEVPTIFIPATLQKDRTLKVPGKPVKIDFFVFFLRIYFSGIPIQYLRVVSSLQRITGLTTPRHPHRVSEMLPCQHSTCSLALCPTRKANLSSIHTYVYINIYIYTYILSMYKYVLYTYDYVYIYLVIRVYPNFGFITIHSTCL